MVLERNETCGTRYRINQFLYGLSPQHESAAALNAFGIFSFLGLVGWLLSLSWFRNPFNQCELPDCRNVNYTVDCGKPHLEYSCRGMTISGHCGQKWPSRDHRQRLIVSIFLWYKQTTINFVLMLLLARQLIPQNRSHPICQNPIFTNLNNYLYFNIILMLY